MRTESGALHITGALGARGATTIYPGGDGEVKEAKRLFKWTDVLTPADERMFPLCLAGGGVGGGVSEAHLREDGHPDAQAGGQVDGCGAAEEGHRPRHLLQAHVPCRPRRVHLGCARVAYRATDRGD
eukprot:1195335-Prorocentrum_minimum.AAC.12